MPWVVEFKHFGDQLCVGMLWQHIACEWHVQNKTISQTRWLFECFQPVFLKSSNPAPPQKKKERLHIFKIVVLLSESKNWMVIIHFFRVTTIPCDSAWQGQRWFDAMRPKWSLGSWRKFQRFVRLGGSTVGYTKWGLTTRNLWGDRFVMQSCCLVG